MSAPTKPEQRHFDALSKAIFCGPGDPTALEQALTELPAILRAQQAEIERLKAQRIGVTLSALMLHEVLDYINPDGRADADQLEAEAHIIWREQFDSIDDDPMSAGYYAYDTAYPEEGLIGPLGEDVAATPPQAAAVGVRDVYLVALERAIENQQDGQVVWALRELAQFLKERINKEPT